MDAAKEDAVDLEERRTQRAIAEKIASDAKLKFLQETEAARRAKEVRQRAHDLNMTYQRWLQLEFPKELAERCIAIMCGPGPTKWTQGALKGWELEVGKLVGDRIFTRHVEVPWLWDALPNFTEEFGQILPYNNGRHRAVKCGRPFSVFLDSIFPRDRDPALTLMKLFARCVPKAREIFTGQYTMARMFHANDYIMEKTFVYGIICLSKWLSKDRFQEGLYGH